MNALKRQLVQSKLSVLMLSDGLILNFLGATRGGGAEISLGACPLLPPLESPLIMIARKLYIPVECEVQFARVDSSSLNCSLFPSLAAQLHQKRMKPATSLHGGFQTQLRNSECELQWVKYFGSYCWSPEWDRSVRNGKDTNDRKHSEGRY